MDDDVDDEPIRPVAKCCVYPVRFFIRLCLFIAGFYWICVTDRRKKVGTASEARILVANHIGIFDPLKIVVDTGTFVVRYWSSCEKTIVSCSSSNIINNNPDEQMNVAYIWRRVLRCEEGGFLAASHRRDSASAAVHSRRARIQRRY